MLAYIGKKILFFVVMVAVATAVTYTVNPDFYKRLSGHLKADFNQKLESVGQTGSGAVTQVKGEAARLQRLLENTLEGFDLTLTPGENTGNGVATISWGEDEVALSMEAVKQLSLDFNSHYIQPARCQDIRTEETHMWCAQHKMSAKKVYFPKWLEQNAELVNPDKPAPQS